ncbi:MAG TPA: radical SAM protein [Candidatus Bathyarchaeia archaeon]|nr:radical SAM protein [Candidatus Bathyarchaeia archaeon]
MGQTHLEAIGSGSTRRRTLVLMEPPFCFWDRSMDRLREGEETIPGVGILVLAALAREKGYAVHVVDAKRAGTTNEDAARRIIALEPDVLGLSCTTISVTNGSRIAELVKAARPHATTIVGGAHVSAIPERTLERFPAFDFGIVGEGEVSLFDLMSRLESGTDVRSVAGLVYRDAERGGKVHANPRAAYLEDLDALPLPAWDLVPNFPYAFSPSMFNYRRSPVGTLITQRGCPFSCTFCDRSTSGRKGRWHSVDYVVRMMRQMQDYGVKHILFYDDLFTVNKARVKELCRAMLDHGMDFSWSCNSHPNLLDEETMRLMKRAGCWSIAYGIESGSQRVLNHVKHEVKIPRLLETLRMTRAAGLRIKGLMMCAHPTETEESLKETERFLRTAPIDLMQLTKFTPYPGTPSYPTIHEYGEFTEDWEHMNAMNFVFVPRGLDVRTLELYFDRIYRSFYSRPDVLLGLARMVIEEPRFLRRIGGYSRTFFTERFRRMRALRRSSPGSRPPWVAGGGGATSEGRPGAGRVVAAS